MSNTDEQNIRLRQALAAGSRTSNQLQALLDISQATLSRIVQRNRDLVLTLGAARSTSYALREPLGGLGSEIPVYVVDEGGDVTPFNTLHLLANGEYGWQLDNQKNLLVDHLPYMIQNMRPEGFMGRAFAHSFGHNLGLPEKLQNWSDRQVISALAQTGEDFIGNIIVGKESVQRYLRSARAKVEAIQPEDRPISFAGHALAAISGDTPGSSAGGEQPKFTALVESPDGCQRVIVKFASRNTDEGQRWSDLLVCESLAAETLTEAGHATAQSEIIQTNDWTFLQSDRFDRVGMWGRLPMFALGAIVAEHIGYCDSWLDAAQKLRVEQLIGDKEVEQIQWLSSFGTLIGNTDMHLGNLSLFPEEKDFRIAPVYDMTSMFYRPRTGGVISTDEIDPDPTNIIADLGEVSGWAIHFWRRVENDPRISAEFKLLSLPNIEAIEALSDGPRLKM